MPVSKRYMNTSSKPGRFRTTEEDDAAAAKKRQSEILMTVGLVMVAIIAIAYMYYAMTSKTKY